MILVELARNVTTEIQNISADVVSTTGFESHNRSPNHLQLLLSLLVHNSHNSTALKLRHVNDQVSTPAAAPAAPDGSCAIL